MCEIVNTHLFDLFRSRARSLLRYRRGGGVRPRSPYYPVTILEQVFAAADAANRRVEKISKGDTLVVHHRGGDGFYRVDRVDQGIAAEHRHYQRVEKYIDELNGQRGVGELVRPGELHQGVRSGDHGERTTPGRQRDDGGALDRREERATAKARWKACKNYKCSGWFTESCDLCVDRQRAGMCSEIRRRNLRFNTPSNVVVGG